MRSNSNVSSKSRERINSVDRVGSPRIIKSTSLKHHNVHFSSHKGSKKAELEDDVAP